MSLFIRRIGVLLFAATLLSLAQAAPVFPVKYSTNSRYLVDQNGTPFPIMGRTAWFITSLSVTDYQTFIDDTVARGYNAIEFHVVNHDPRGNNPPFNGSGARPFLNRLNGTSWNGALTYGNINNEAPNFTTPNEAYWSSVDGLLSYCESKGILVFLFPAYVGYGGGDQGWMQEIVANGASKIQSYGAWIATRYKNRKNLVWMMGGDFGSFNSAQTSVEGALLTGLKSVSGQQSVLFSAEWQSGTIASDQGNFGGSMTLNGAYSWTGDVNSLGRRAYARSPVMPAYLQEEPFDEEGSDGNGFNPSATQPVRRFQWWGWLSTIGGYISGNGYIWPFSSNWRNHLNTQGSRDMARLNAFMGSIDWYELVPSGLNGMRTLITSGGSSVSASDYVTAAAAPDGTLLVAYVPPAHSGSITVDMGAMSGPTRARWFDPTSAAYTTIGTGLANSGSRSFTPPGNNSAGAKDWVLVLDFATGSSPASPTISDIADQSTTVGTATAAIPFTIGDADTSVSSLSLSKGTSNSALVPANNIVFGGSGSSRTVTVTPAPNQTGSATITVTVSDGSRTASDTFVLTVNAVATGTGSTSFTNATAITIPDQGAATPYPSTINVSGMSGAVNNVTVTLRNLTQTWVSDVDVLLVGPTGQKVMLMSDAGSGNVNNVTLTLSDAAASPLPSTALASGTFRPANYSDASPGGDNYPSPAPAGPYAATLSAFNGTTPNGTWSLYVFDDGPGDSGRFAGGWSLTVTPLSDTSSAVPTISNIPDQTTTVNTPTVGIPFTIGDADTSVSSLTLSKGTSNSTLVPANNIVFGGSGSSRTVTVTPAANQTGTATITVTVSDGSLTASDTFVLTVSAANNSLPTVVLTSPANGASYTAPTSVNLAANVTANGHTITKVQFYNGTSLLGEDTTTPYSYTWNNVSSAGSYSLMARAVYDAGSTVDSTPANITVTSASGTGPVTFNNSAAITIPSVGTATPYPSTINVSGLSGTISTVTVVLKGLSHTWGNDIDVLLVGPGGQKMIVLSDAGTGSTANNANLTFSDGAAATLPQTGSLVSGTYKPTDYTPSDAFPSPAPAGPYATTLSTFNGQSANGAWSLYVMDDGAGDQGSFASGWSLTITTAGAGARSSILVEESPRITSIMIDGQGAVRVTVIGKAGLGYALEASGDLLNWTKVEVLENVTGSIVFTEQPTNAIRFYRAVSVSE